MLAIFVIPFFLNHFNSPLDINILRYDYIVLRNNFLLLESFSFYS